MIVPDQHDAAPVLSPGRLVEQRASFDCMTACLATIFGVPYEDAPVLADPETCEPIDQWLRVMTLWLHERGFHPQSFSLDQRIIDSWGPRPARSPWYWPTLWMGGVLSPRFEEDGEPGHHAVVMQGNDLVYDPHPQREMGHLGFVSAEIFLPRDPAMLVHVPMGVGRAAPHRSSRRPEAVALVSARDAANKLGPSVPVGTHEEPRAGLSPDGPRISAANAPGFALFSGGHDSLCATHVAMTNGYAQEVVHVNTGIGVEQTREFVRETCARFGWPLNELSPPIPYDDLVLQHGFPGPAGHQFMYRRLKERCLAAFARERKPRRGAPLVYCTGVRKQESDRRARGQQTEWQHAPKLGWTWRAVILEWSKGDCNRYIEEKGLPRNPVVDTLHMSGECLCGSFAKPGEIDEIRLWFPETAARIAALEQRVAATGNPACVWGRRPPNVARGQLELLPGMLCSSCVYLEEQTA